MNADETIRKAIEGACKHEQQPARLAAAIYSWFEQVAKGNEQLGAADVSRRFQQMIDDAEVTSDGGGADD